MGNKRVVSLSAGLSVVVLLLLVAVGLAQAREPSHDESPPLKATPIPWRDRAALKAFSPQGDGPLPGWPAPEGENPAGERPWRQSRATFPAATGMAAAASPGDEIDVLIWKEDFESGVDSWSWDGLWHLITDTHPSGYGNSHSPVSSFWYGQNSTGDYDTGDLPNSGALTLTVPVSLPASLSNATLSFWSWEETECGGGSCRWDRRRTQVGIDGPSPSWKTVWNTRTDDTTEGSWHRVDVDLTPYVGNDILLRFTFDTVDRIANEYRGWYIDDLAVGYDLMALLPWQQEGYGWRGDTVSHTLRLGNQTGVETAFDMGFSGNTWPTALSTDTLGPLPDGGSADFEVYVTIPSDACPGCSDLVEVSATSVSSPTVGATAQVLTRHYYDVWLFVWPGTAGLSAGDTFTHTALVRNRMGFDDSFTLTVVGNSWPAILSTSNTGVVGDGATLPFTVGVSVPADTPLGASDSFTLTATSDTKPLYYASEVVLTYCTEQGGYRYEDSDAGACTYEWLDVTGAPQTFDFGDDDFATVDLGFDFPFYGNTQSQVKVSSNGFLTFDGAPWEFFNLTIPVPTEPNDLIAPFWTDLYPPGNWVPGESLVFVQTLGTVPNRYAVVEWYRIPYLWDYPSFDPLTFEAILYESGQMKFQYQEMRGPYGDGGASSVGVENSSGLVGVEYLFGGSPSQNAIHDGLAVCWGFPNRVYLPLVLKQY